MSSGATGDGGGGGRFSDDLEKLISRAGEKAGRGAKGQGSAVALPAEGEGAVATQGGGGEAAGEEEEDPKLSARAMKFRAMISKLRPQKKKIVVKVCKVPRYVVREKLERKRKCCDSSAPFFAVCIYLCSRCACTRSSLRTACVVA